MLDLSKIAAAVKHEGGISRRLFLAYAASLSAVPYLGQQASARTRQAVFPSDPFSLGVASGDPTSSGVVLWTRLAPKPLEEDGGMHSSNVQVVWEVATDENMRCVVRRGRTIATPELAHSVHVEVEGLKPGRWYWYRFRAGEAESRLARTRTMAADGSSPSNLRMAFASCQNYQSGYFTAYEHMAKEDLDLVLHLGDYIYDHGHQEDAVRKHTRGETKTLSDYRLRHSQYKTDRMLQKMHSRCPWMVTWDDHEVCNNYTSDHSGNRRDEDPIAFLKRRAAAYQAYYENMPMRRSSMPHGPKMQMYRKQSYGMLADIIMLDGRQYRTSQPNGDKLSDINEAACSPKNTMLGRKQFGWVKDSLARSEATWKLLANQVIMALVDEKPGSERKFSMDEWCGYVHERNELMKFVEDQKITNTIVITGDNHKNWVNDLRADDLRPETPVIATEFVGTSITSGGDGNAHSDRANTLMSRYPGVRFYNEQRGYVRCTITPNLWQSDFRTVAKITKPGAPVTTRASFIIEAGEAGAKQA